ncbi:MAG: MobF family relaxase [Planctomycetaceae bacterium]|nr:MobF family relaxase [Planctomycetaceae bacterium]
MLRIIESNSAGHARTYFSTADYYSEGQELLGQWRGAGAKRLGLEGVISPEAWDALCDNRHPETGERLTLRTRLDRRVGYDFNFHVPKSLSVLYALTEDERLLQAFRDAVGETMEEIEAEMQTRVRKAGRNADRITGNMVWGEFVHFTSRPVDGVPDPHLHAHCFVFNQTWDEQEQSWKAGQFGDLKRDAPYFEARFHVRLAQKLGELGLPVERTQQGWEISGLTPGLMSKYSRRTQEIEEEAERKGITDPAQKAELGAKTRSRKQKDVPLALLREEWRTRLSNDERESLARVAAAIGGAAPPTQANCARDAVTLATEHAFERQSVVPERSLLAESLKRSVGRSTVQSVERAFAEERFLVRERRGRRMVTTAAVLAEEREMLDFARQGRGTRRPIAAGPHHFQRDWLNDGQRRAVEHVLHATDRVILIRGAAGVGKTSMMQEAVEAIEAAGSEVFTFAPSARASRGVLREKGFDEADTVSRLLLDEQLQQRIAGQVIWIDEAGLVGTRTMARVFELANALDARIILSGDRRQHGSVERGAALRLLEEQAGLVPAEIKEIQRQRERYKQVVLDLSEDRVADGFRKLDELGWIREVPDEERDRMLARDYVETVLSGETALVVSPTHREAGRITRAIRDGLRRHGKLAAEERQVATLVRSDLTEGERKDAVNYAPGDVLIFHQNAKGFTKGQRVTITAAPPPVEQAARFQVFHPSQLEIAAGDVLRITQNGKTADGRGRLNNGDLLHVTGFDPAGNILTAEKKTIGREFGHLAYGFVTTSHASQGTDVERVFIGQSADSFPASSREQFYVSVSRGRKQATVYTGHKAELLDAVRRSDERLSATELLSGDMLGDRLAVFRSVPEPRSTLPERTKEELLYDR